MTVTRPTTLGLLALLVGVALLSASARADAQDRRRVMLSPSACARPAWDDARLARALRVELQSAGLSLAGAASGPELDTIRVALEGACGASVVRVVRTEGSITSVREVDLGDLAYPVRARALALVVADLARAELAVPDPVAPPEPVSSEPPVPQPAEGVEATPDASAPREADVARLSSDTSQIESSREGSLDPELAAGALSLADPSSARGAFRPVALRAYGEITDLVDDGSFLGGGGAALSITFVPELPLAVFVRARVIAGSTSDQGGSAGGLLVEGSAGLEAWMDLAPLRLGALVGLGAGYVGMDVTPTPMPPMPRLAPLHEDHATMLLDVGLSARLALLDELALFVEGGVRPYLVGVPTMSTRPFPLHDVLPWLAVGAELRL